MAGVRTVGADDPRVPAYPRHATCATRTNLTAGPTDDIDERGLVRSCIAGDPGAWDQLVARYRPHVLRVARAHLERLGVSDVDALADDTSADVFSLLLADDRRALAQFEWRASLATWLGVLARRRASWLLARAERGAQLLVLACLGARDGTTPSEEASGHERAALVRAALRQLPPRDRQALELFYEAGRTYKEVAEVMALPEAHVSSLLARARKRLARELGG